ncbi:MAG: type I secretion system permease/ATPase [Bacteroidetes bacterium]|nr:type I secretion system permease/ATPase [Bacteroidota bacterium]
MCRGLLKETFLKYKKIFRYALGFSLIINLLTLPMAIYSLQVLDRVISSGSLETLLMLTIIVCACLAALGFLNIVRSFIFFQISKNLDNDLSTVILKNSISTYSSQKNISPTQLSRDFSTLKSFVSGQIMHTIFDAPWAIIFIIAIFFVHYINGFVVLIAAILLLFLAYLNDYAIKHELKKANEANVKSLSYIEFSSRNAEVIEVMGMKSNLIKHWQNIANPANDLQQKVNEKTTVISSLTKSIRMLIQVFMMGIGAYLVINRQMTAGGIIATSILAGKALAPFDAAVNIWKSYVNTKKSYDRVDKFLKITENTDILENTLLPESQGNITVDKLVFAPSKSLKPILKGLSFEVKQGEIIGIIGPSGAGKTTLAKLLVGIYKPNSGTVRLDNAEVYRWEKEHLGKFIGYMPQDIELFSGNIKTNIARMDEEPDNDKVLKAAQIVSANELILHLEKGYETEVGAGASHLSAGQAQRIGLARAFYNEPKLIILDEPNSHLDIKGEQAFAGAIAFAKQKQITMIIIAHRTSVLGSVDKIMVMEDGLIKIFDDKEKVIEQLRGNTN